MTKDDKLKTLSRLCAVFLVLQHAVELLTRRIERLAYECGMYMERENKQAVNGIAKAARQVQFHMERISDWSIDAVRTDHGEVGTTEAFTVLQQDASDALELILNWVNMSHATDDGRLKVISYMKVLAKGDETIPTEEINKLKLKL